MVQLRYSGYLDFIRETLVLISEFRVDTYVVRLDNYHLFVFWALKSNGGLFEVFLFNALRFLQLFLRPTVHGTDSPRHLNLESSWYRLKK